MPEHISMLGMSSDQMEAATITPEAKPKRVFCNFAGISSFMKNTKPEPRVVPMNGIISASTNPSITNCKGTLFILERYIVGKKTCIRRSTHRFK